MSQWKPLGEISQEANKKLVKDHQKTTIELLYIGRETTDKVSAPLFI